jgi:energy-coupling factor transporter ATP-binding protein EcfA2
MSRKIQIKNLKSIGLLDFELPPVGVYVLTGENGCGKTSLLACITRLGQRDSFPRHFRTSTASKKLDNFDAAEITYLGPLHTVVYKYSGFRWEPTPKGNSKGLLMEFGYSEVLYVAADDKRVTPRQEDFKPSKIKPASGFIISHADKIFGTTKFQQLRVVNVRRGPGQQAFVFEKQGPKTAIYYSERNFSLGELAVLKLLRVLDAVRANALVVIDELELALYPLAQERLLKAIEEIASARNLTVIFSTHSATLIRSIAPTNLLFLERQGNEVVCVSNCYPTYALGRIGSPGEASPDVVLLVEDPNAEAFLTALRRQSASQLFHGCAHPTIQIAPIGGYENVLKFLAKASTLFSAQTRVQAALDKDCEAVLVPPSGSKSPPIGSKESKTCLLYQSLASQTKFLPETPEVGLMNLLAANWASAKQHMCSKYFNNSLMTISAPSFTGNSLVKGDRKRAKSELESVVERLIGITGRPEREIVEELFHWYVGEQEKLTNGWAAGVMGPLVR